MQEDDEHIDEHMEAVNERLPDDQLQEALQEAMGDSPRSDELQQMKAVLAERRARLCQELDTAEDATEREALRRELKKLDEQVAALGEEAEITRFVEDTVRFSLEMRRLN